MNYTKEKQTQETGEKNMAKNPYEVKYTIKGITGTKNFSTINTAERFCDSIWMKGGNCQTNWRI
jgi:hypothetical protein